MYWKFDLIIEKPSKRVDIEAIVYLLCSTKCSINISLQNWNRFKSGRPDIEWTIYDFKVYQKVRVTSLEQLSVAEFSGE